MDRPPDCEAASMLNEGERRLLAVLSEFCARHASWLTVSPQVSYGAFLNTRERGRWREISRKRADFVLWSPRDGFVYAVVEFDGAGHWGRQKNEYEAARNSDAVKNHACATAGIPIVRVLQDYAPSAVRETLLRALGMKKSRGRWWSLIRREPAEAGRKEPPLRAEPPISTDHPEF